MITQQDDYFHKSIQTDDPFWNESAWFGFAVPERNLSGFIYFYHRPNMNYTVGGAGLWDPSGAETYDCLYYDFSNTFAMPKGCEMFDFELPNGLKVECIEPLQKFKLKYGGDSFYWGATCQMDLEWEAFLPPHQTGQPPGQNEWAPAKNHYEQPGRMKGSVTIRGEKLDIDCWSLRDHSWGVRHLKNDTRGFFPWGIASEKSGFLVYAMSDLPPGDDDIGVVDLRIAAGWYLKDGTYGTLTQGLAKTTRRGAQGQPLEMEMSGTDSLGRDFYVKGRAKNMLNAVLYPFLFQWWAMFEWELDGQTCYGEEMDFIPLQHARNFIRTVKG